MGRMRARVYTNDAASTRTHVCTRAHARTHTRTHLGRRPSTQLARQLDSNVPAANCYSFSQRQQQLNVLGRLQLPRQPSHHVHRISTTNTHSTHAQAAGVDSVAVSADHHAAGDGVVLQYDLVDE